MLVKLGIFSVLAMAMLAGPAATQAKERVSAKSTQANDRPPVLTQWKQFLPKIRRRPAP